MAFIDTAREYAIKAEKAIVSAYQWTLPMAIALWNQVQPKIVSCWQKIRPKNRKEQALFAAGCIGVVWLLLPLFSKTAPELKKTTEGLPSYEAFIVDPAEAKDNTPLRSLPRYQEISILKPFKVVVAFNALVPNRSYEVRFELYDRKGNLVSEENAKPFTSTPSQKIFDIFATFTPDWKKHSPGKWALRVKLSGVGTVSHTFTILPPTPTEQADLARHEKARETAFQAFCNYWLGMEHRGDIMYLSCLESGAGNITVNGNKVVTAGTHPAGAVPDAIASARFFQVAGVTNNFYQDNVSQADRLNGITYRGRAAMSFTAFRSYHPESGWTKWVDVKRPGSDMEGAMAEYFKQVMSLYRMVDTNPDFEDPPLAHALRFEIYEQDGNWFAVSDLGDLYANGVKKGQAMPDAFKAQSATLLPDKTLSQPTLEAAKIVVTEGKNPRDMAKALGDSVRASPEATANQVVQTMRLLRGRSL